MPMSPTQRVWRARIETGLRLAGPALDLLLAAGDRVCRVTDRRRLEPSAAARDLDASGGGRTSLSGAGAERDGTSD